MRSTLAGWSRASALTLFALSGCAGLIYQSVWTQYLGLFLGHAAYAQSLVLAIYMGGMAIGAWWASVRGLRLTNLLRAYALVELLIGIAGAVFHPAYTLSTQFAYDTVFPALGGGATGQIFKWTGSVLLILPQSILLGATFPLMSNGLLRRLRGDSGAILSGLYFTNSMGAAVGALVSTFLLLPAFGLPGAMRFAAALNIIVAIAAYALSRISGADEARPSENTLAGTAPAKLLLSAAFVTGATSFVYEIGWVRMLNLVLGSTIHSFELMLAAFVGGLACGALWLRRRIDGYARPVLVVGVVQVLMGAAALASLVLYDHVFDLQAWIMRALAHSEDGYALFNVAGAVIAMVMMAPAAFFAGMTLPLLTVALQRGANVETSVGRIYAANTVGAIVGVFAGMHLLIPVLGLKLAMILAAAGDLALGVVLLRRTLAAERTGAYFASVAACGVALIITLLTARFDPAAMSGGVFRTGQARRPASERVVFYRDGKTASVSVGASSEAYISTNGKPDAGIQLAADRPPTADELTMVMLAAVPLALHPNPQSAAVIGFGSGMTTHTLLGDSRLQSVDTIEIEPAMYEGAKAFGKHVERAYLDPRSHVRFDDARAYFAANQARYDIIVSEPSNPWVSGVANLFSAEFYRFVPRHLNRGGLLVQWMHLYEIDDELAATIVRALAASFVDYRIYLTSDLDMLIVASADGPLGIASDRIFDEPALRDALMRVSVTSPAALALHELGDRRSLGALFSALTTRSNSDYFPIVSLEAPRKRFAKRIAETIDALDHADLPLGEVLSGRPPPDDISEISASPHFFRSFLAVEARGATAALANRSTGSGNVSADMARAIAYVRSSVGECSESKSGASEVDTLIGLAGITIPYVDAGHSRDTWAAPRWIECTTHASAVSGALAVIGALAQRDFASVRKAATQLLREQKKALSPTAQDWFLRAAMLAAIAQGDFADVRQIDESLGKDIPLVPSKGQVRRYLLALADERIKANAKLGASAAR